MRRRLTSSLILACGIALALPVTAPAQVAAGGAVGQAAAAGSTLGGPPSDAARPLTASRVPSVAANARMHAMLARRTKSAVLGSRFTMTVWDPDSRSYVYRKRSTAAVRGASTTKILTAVGVLRTLGAAHRLPTTVRAGASGSEVVLVAGGDPLLTSANLRALARSTAAALRARATGPTNGITVRADDSLFADSRRAVGWYSRWLPRQVRPVTAFARDDRTVRDATADAGAYFASALRRAGIKATYRGEAVVPPGAATLARYAGHTVGQAVSRALLVSDNDTAEMLFRLTAVGRGLPGTWAGARRAQHDALREVGVPLAGVRIIDGSGLSLQGRLTAKALTAALAAAISPDHPELAALRGWLPLAGRTGTLKASYRRFSSRPARCAAGRIQAKTGTLADAIALAGYATGADGRTKIFVSVVNRRPTRFTRTQTRTAVDKVAATVTGCW